MMDDHETDLLTKIYREIGVVGAKVEGIDTKLDETTIRVEKRLNAHSEKIESLDRSRSKLRGMLAVGGVAITGAAVGVTEAVKKIFD